ncbi:MliC family protein, partial [Streptomyces sp. P9(2023)]|uniref:MliC family protein n=1 Tax=Streptomyces sp. P9(2023) TaxID=3064394 RepID=UPI0028F42BA7
MKITIAIAALAALSVPSLASANEVTHVKYACDGNKILDVVYTGEIAVMLQDDELVPMKRATSGSGVRYVPISEDYTYELWGKDDNMT